MSRLSLLLVALLVLGVPLFAACSGGGDDAAPPQQAGMTSNVPDVDMPQAMSPEELAARIEKYAQVDISYDESVLSDPEKEALAKLVQAGQIMDEIFYRQVWAGNVEMRRTLAALQETTHAEGGDRHQYAENLAHFFRINFGPWDRLEADEPFIGTDAKPLGAGYYPEDLTKEEFDAYIAANPDEEEALRGYFTTVKRTDDGGLEAVPYNEEYKDYLQQAAALLHETADILTKSENEAKFRSGIDYTTLAAYLRARADAFSSNDYRPSDMAWMDVKDNIIDVTIGPYEVYEDLMNGHKAAFEAYIAMRHPEDSAKLDGIKQYLQLLENKLPIPDEHKNPNRGSESPISVVDLVYSGGDTKAGVQTLAFNLPNDEYVRELKGSKKVLLKNIQRAKYDEILMPIAETLLDKEQIKYVTFEAYFNNTLMHEMSHGIGPGTITVDGKETTVSLALAENYTAIEECKADISGLFCTKILVGEGFFEPELEHNGYITFLPGFFRSIRFGATSAHGRANVIEFNWMREKGAIVFNEETQRFTVDVDKMPEAVESLTSALLMVQAEGSYDKAQEFLDKYANVTPDLEKMLAKLSDIPTDIEPIYRAEKKYLGEQASSR